MQGVIDTPLAEANTPAVLERQQVKDLPDRPFTVTDALPLTPGILRLPSGELMLSGSGEHRSALLVNSITTTDPATGQFGATVPIDSVRSMTILTSPFLAEYGGFTADVVTVETRKGGDKWTFELNDPLPEFRWRSWHMVGLRSSTPRVNFGGPVDQESALSAGIGAVRDAGNAGDHAAVPEQRIPPRRLQFADRARLHD